LVLQGYVLRQQRTNCIIAVVTALNLKIRATAGNDLALSPKVPRNLFGFTRVLDTQFLESAENE